MPSGGLKRRNTQWVIGVNELTPPTKVARGDASQTPDEGGGRGGGGGAPTVGGNSSPRDRGASAGPRGGGGEGPGAGADLYVIGSEGEEDRGASLQDAKLASLDTGEKCPPACPPPPAAPAARAGELTEKIGEGVGGERQGAELPPWHGGRGVEGAGGAGVPPGVHNDEDDEAGDEEYDHQRFLLKLNEEKEKNHGVEEVEPHVDKKMVMEQVRERKKKLPPYTPLTPEAQQREFKGDTIWHTSFEGDRRDDEPELPQQCTLQDLLGQTSLIKAAIFTSYGTDYPLMEDLLQDMPKEVWDFIVFVDNYDPQRNPPQVHEPDPDVCVHARVVWPWMCDFHDDASRAGAERGTMHPKLMIVCYEACPERGAFVRVCISSRNLAEYERGLYNIYWVCDFPRRALAGGELPAFGADLALFVDQILSCKDPTTLAPADPSAVDAASVLRLEWAGRLAQYDLRAPEGVHLVSSVPGWREGKDADAVGHLRVRKLLKEHLPAVPEGLLDHRQAVYSQVSSYGRLVDGDYQALQTSFCVDQPEEKIHVVWYSRDKVSDMHRQRLNGEKVNLTEVWLSDMPWKDKEGLWVHPVPTWKGRTHAMTHLKVYAATLEKPGDPKAPVLCRWVMVGSHNLSKVAWGLGPRQWRGPDGKGTLRYAQVITSWELSVLLIPEAPKQFPLPFELRERHKYGPAERPHSVKSHAEMLEGKGDAEPGARKEVAAAVEALKERFAKAKQAKSFPQQNRMPNLFSEPYASLAAKSDKSSRLVLFASVDRMDRKGGGGLKMYEGRLLDMWSDFLFCNALCSKEAADKIDEVYGGLLALFVGENRGLPGPDHGDALCLKFKIRNKDLPALVVVKGKRHHIIVSPLGPMSIREAVRHADSGTLGRELKARADAWVERADRKERAQREQMRCMQESSEQMMGFAAEWVRERFKLVVLETERVLKKRVNLADTRKAAAKNFIEYGVPFFKALVQSESEGPQLAVLSGMGISPRSVAKEKDEEFARCRESVRRTFQELEEQVCSGAQLVVKGVDAPFFSVERSEEAMVGALRKMAARGGGAENTLVIGDFAGPRTIKVAEQAKCCYLHCEYLWGLTGLSPASCRLEKEELFSFLDDKLWEPSKGAPITGRDRVRIFHGMLLPGLGI